MTEDSLRQVVLASANAGKLREFARLFQPLALQLHSQAEFDVPEVAETGLSFVENAIIKARAAAEHCCRRFRP
jgi:XTP/dITP diphosphohydrolase